MSAGAAPPRRERSGHLVAALVTAAVPTVLASLWLWSAPSGCNPRGDPASYRWACLLPAIILMVAPVTGIAFGGCALLSRRLADWIGSSWMVTPAVWGLLVHLGVVGSVVLTDPAYVALFLRDILLVPQPFVAGAAAAAIYTATVRLLRRHAAR